jgi:hypothetical protein
MPKKKVPRPSTPILRTDTSPNVGPTSPPQTPTITSPQLQRRKAGPQSSLRHPPPFQNLPLPTVSQTSNIRPNGTGPHFSYTRPHQLSPRESESESESSGKDSLANENAVRKPGNTRHGSDAEDEESEDEDEDEEGSELEKPLPKITVRAKLTAKISFTIEEMSDFEPMDSDYDRLDVLRPHDIEYANSDRSRSRSRNPPELDPHMMQGIQDLNCSNSSEEIDEDEAHREFMRNQRELRMRKRRTHGSSLSKRTHSERGDSDREDIQSVDMNDDLQSLDPSRRTRRKMGEARWSKSFLDFQGFPPPPIHEVEETNTDEEVTTDGTRLFKELPYYMEIDSC